MCIQLVTKVSRKVSLHFPRCFGCEMLPNAEGTHAWNGCSAVAAVADTKLCVNQKVINYSMPLPGKIYRKESCTFYD